MQAESAAEDPVSSSGSGEAAEQQGGQGWLSGFKLPWQAEAAQNGSQNQVSRDHSRGLFWVSVRVRAAGGEPPSLRLSPFTSPGRRPFWPLQMTCATLSQRDGVRLSGDGMSTLNRSTFSGKWVLSAVQAASADVPENVQEAREWIRAWRARSASCTCLHLLPHVPKS